MPTKYGPHGAALAALFSALFLLSVTRTYAQSPNEYFHEKTIRLIIATAPGGDRALYALPFATYLGRHIPGNPTVEPVFMPGAGGAVAMNYLYNVAKPDGLSIATPLSPVVIAQATGDKSVKYDVAKMNWIGRAVDASRVFFIRNNATVRTFDDLRKSQVPVGSTGVSSETFINPAVMNYFLGTKFKIITGYHGAVAVNMAAERGETDGAFTTWNDVYNIHADWVRDHEITVLFQIGLTKKDQNIPLLTDFATAPLARSVIEFMSSTSQMGQSFVAPPNVPADIIKILRDGFDATMKDPEFLASMKKGGLEINPMNGADLTLVVMKTIGATKDAVEGYQAAIKAAQESE